MSAWRNMAERRSTDDLYAVLGVEPHASAEDIVRAYRRLALTSHPDARPKDPGASARFRALTHAYVVLSDPVQRADYDRTLTTRRGGSVGATEARLSVQVRRWPSPPGRHPYESDPRARVRPLWAGPVYVEIPRASIHRGVHPENAFAELASLLRRYLGAPPTGRWL
jgi:curved DNA-binding protein CbpA